MPNTPQLEQPADGTIGINPKVELKWNAVSTAVTYILQVSTLTNFTDMVINKEDIEESNFVVELLPEKIYHWRVCAVNEGGKSPFSDVWTFSTSSTAVTNHNKELPSSFGFLPAYPNPFNSTVTFIYQLPKLAEIELVIYNTVGHRVRTLAADIGQPGYHTINWNGIDSDGNQAPSGMYLCCLNTNNKTFFQKILLVR